MRLKLGTFASSSSIPLSISYSTTSFSRGSNSTVLTPTVTGGSGTKTYSYAGTLPPDTSFNTSTGAITGPSALKGVYTPRVLSSKIGTGEASDSIDNIAIGPDGSIYIVGNMRGSITINGITYTPQMAAASNPFMGFVAKYNPDGSWAWFKPVQATNGTALLSVSISPTDGSVYVCGYVKTASVTLDSLTVSGFNSDGSDAIFVGKLSSDGVWQWGKLPTAGGAGVDRAQGVRVSPDGSGAYVVGYSSTTTTLSPTVSVGTTAYQSAFLARIQSNGTWQWSTTNAETGINVFNDLSLDSSGNPHAVGTSAISGVNQAILVKYTTAGSITWTQRSSTTNPVFGRGVYVDSSGNVHITGTTTGAFSGFINGGGNDTFLRKYNSSGTLLWTQQQGGAGNEQGIGITVDSSGNVYVTNQTSGTTSTFFNGASYPLASTSLAGFITSFSSSGTPRWIKIYDSTGIDILTRIVSDSGDRIHVVGYFGTATWTLGDTTFTVPASYDSVVGMINKSNGDFIGNTQPGFPSSLTVSVSDATGSTSLPLSLTYG